MSINVVLKSIFDDKGLRDASKSLRGFSGSMKSTLGALGVGVGIGAIVSGLKEASREAVSDAKSQQILANSLRNTVGASSQLIASVEGQIKAFSMATGVADDELRPAYQSLVTATGSVAKAQTLMSLALNVAADKNIAVADAANVLGKAVNGTTRGLYALYPNLKQSSDWMGELSRQTAGAADAAANADPIQRLTTIFNEMQETIGYALIPYLQQMASYLASDMGQAQINKLAGEIALLVSNTAGAVAGIIEFASENQILVDVLGGLIAVILAVKAAMTVWAAATTIAAAAQWALDAAMAVLNPAIWVSIGAAVAFAGTMGYLAVESNKSTEAIDNASTGFKNLDITIQNAKSSLQGFQSYMDSTGKTTKEKAKPDPNTAKPINPKPGEVYTFWKQEGDLYVWYTQTWTGKNWTKAKKMTYTPPVAEKKQKVESEAEKRRKAAIKKQKEDYKSLADSVKQSFASIQQSIMGAFDITQMGSSAGRVMSNVRRLIEQTKKFAESIRKLQEQKLNPDLINQLISAGPINAGRLAANLVTSGLGKELSNAYTEYGGLATGIARMGIQSMYSPGSTQNNITIAAGLGTKEQIASAVIDAIKYYEKQNGSGWRK